MPPTPTNWTASSGRGDEQERSTRRNLRRPRHSRHAAERLGGSSPENLGTVNGQSRIHKATVDRHIAQSSCHRHPRRRSSCKRELARRVAGDERAARVRILGCTGRRGGGAMKAADMVKWIGLLAEARTTMLQSDVPYHAIVKVDEVRFAMERVIERAAEMQRDEADKPEAA